MLAQDVPIEFEACEGDSVSPREGVPVSLTRRSGGGGRCSSPPLSISPSLTRSPLSWTAGGGGGGWRRWRRVGDVPPDVCGDSGPWGCQSGSGPVTADLSESPTAAGRPQPPLPVAAAPPPPAPPPGQSDPYCLAAHC